jgi:hypothetical protein
MEKDSQKNVVNHFEAGSNCQVFNGNITGCTFAMPGATVTQQAAARPMPLGGGQPEVFYEEERTGELCHFIHPAVDSRQEWLVNDEVCRLVSRQGIQEICRHLLKMSKDNKLLLPQSPAAAYAELVRMGMPNGAGFNEKTFKKYYRRA